MEEYTWLISVKHNLVCDILSEHKTCDYEIPEISFLLTAHIREFAKARSFHTHRTPAKGISLLYFIKRWKLSQMIAKKQYRYKYQKIFDKRTDVSLLKNNPKTLKRPHCMTM